MRAAVFGVLGAGLLATQSAGGRPPVPTPIGAAPAFHPSARNAAAEAGRPIGSLRCARAAARRDGAHLELFAHGKVVVVPAGVGMAVPLKLAGPYVVSGRCSYPVRTREPTGVIELETGSRVTLGDFFAVWGRVLGRNRLVSFRARAPSRLRAYVNGRLFGGPPGSIVLRRHLEVVLELGSFVPPHTTYRFRKGL
jgi:hypothetical protein